jgi:ribonuclease HI
MDQYKQIKFEHQLAADIENGKKTTTFRFFDDKHIQVGDVLDVIDKVQQDNPASWQVIGTMDVREVIEKRVRDLSASDWAGHETYQSSKVFLDTFRYYYGKPIDEETPVKIIRFIFAKADRKRPFLSEGTDLDLPTEVKLFADGGSRGNPGPSAGGFVVLDMNDTLLRASSKYLGLTTNNQAEYHALKGGLELCLANHVRTVHVYLDSLLVVNQMKGIFKIKNRELWPIHEAVQKLLAQFEKVNFTHVPRELNKLADAEVNKALDALKNEQN